MVNYEWKVKKSTLNVQVTLVAGDVRFVSIQDSFSVKKKFGDEFDFASEFEKSIALLNSLRE